MARHRPRHLVEPAADAGADQDGERLAAIEVGVIGFGDAGRRQGERRAGKTNSKRVHVAARTLQCSQNQ